MGALNFPVGSVMLGVVKSTGTVKHFLRGEREKQRWGKLLPWVFFPFAFCSQWIPSPLGTILALGDFCPALISAQPDSGLPEKVSFLSR